MTDETSFNDLRWFIRMIIGATIGVIVLGIVAVINLLFALPRFFTEDWTWREMLAFPVQITALGILSGAAVGLLFPVVRFGRIGDAIVGIVGGNIFFFVCLAIFGRNAILKPQVDVLLIVAAAGTLIGGWIGLSAGKELRRHFEEEALRQDQPDPTLPIDGDPQEKTDFEP